MNQYLKQVVNKSYEYGFETIIESDEFAPGLSEETILRISEMKNEPEFMREWRLKAYRHWLTMTPPRWAHLHYPDINYQDVIYYSAPKTNKDGPKTIEEVDPKLLETYKKLGIPLHEQGRLAGVAVDAVFDSVSVATTFKEKLREAGVIFCSFSEAAVLHSELVEKYLGTVVSYQDNFFAALNAAVFSDGSFVYFPICLRFPI